MDHPADESKQVASPLFRPHRDHARPAIVRMLSMMAVRYAVLHGRSYGGNLKSEGLCLLLPLRLIYPLNATHYYSKFHEPCYRRVAQSAELPNGPPAGASSLIEGLGAGDVFR